MCITCPENFIILDLIALMLGDGKDYVAYYAKKNGQKTSVKKCILVLYIQMYKEQL
jgi:hypothetical protein